MKKTIKKLEKILKKCWQITTKCANIIRYQTADENINKTEELVIKKQSNEYNIYDY